MAKSKKKVQVNENNDNNDNEKNDGKIEIEESASKSKMSKKSNKSTKSLKSLKSTDNLSEIDEKYNENEDPEITSEIEIIEEEKIIDFTKSKKTDLIHVLPSLIDYEGHAPVSTFFEPTIQKDLKNENYLTSTFRGKLFRGKVVNHHIQFVEFKKLKNSELSNEEKNQNITKLLINDVENQKQFYVWEFDKYFEDKSDNLVNIKSILSDLDVLS